MKYKIGIDDRALVYDTEQNKFYELVWTKKSVGLRERPTDTVLLAVKYLINEMTEIKRIEIKST